MQSFQQFLKSCNDWYCAFLETDISFSLVGNKANTKSVEWTLGCSQLACAINKERTSHSVGEALAGSAHH